MNMNKVGINVLGIDTSCDDTAVAVVAGGRRIRSSIVLSQQALHAEHGGVVPEVASRRHLEAIRPAVTRALDEAGLTLDDIDLVAATVGPGLAGSLMVGYNFGRALALGRGLPFAPVNHLEGHIYSAWLIPPDREGENPPAPALPLLVLIVSGGHTELVLMTDHGVYQRLGGTRDDAAGEAFDKVGRLLGLPYPGGPAVQRAAAALPEGVVAATLPRAWMRGSHDFSFSGLKTAVLHLTRDTGENLDEARVDAIAAGFQDSVADVLATKTVAAAREYGARGVALCGGVAANQAIRERLRRLLPAELPLHVPPPVLCTDNGAMIAAAGYYRRVEAVSAAGSGLIQPNLALPV
jgi:N6-L-threonylcarbamoyladenine synthase